MTEMRNLGDGTIAIPFLANYEIQEKMYTHHYAHIYTFILCNEFHVAHMQAKFSQICLYHITGWSGLL